MKRKGKILAVIVIAVIISGIVAYVVLLPPPSPEIVYGETYYRHFAENAEQWFRKWGWIGEEEESLFANRSIVLEMLNHSYYLYLIGHGGWRYISIREGGIWAWDVPDSRVSYNFVMLCSCGALDRIGEDNTWEGELDDPGYKILVGYSGMGSSLCWRRAYRWQNEFFSKLDEGMTFGEAYNGMWRNYPTCRDTILIYGDLNLTVEDLTIPRWDVNQDGHINILDLIEIGQHWTG